MQETQETWVWSLNREDPLEEGVVTHTFSSLLEGKNANQYFANYVYVILALGLLFAAIYPHI